MAIIAQDKGGNVYIWYQGMVWDVASVGDYHLQCAGRESDIYLQDSQDIAPYMQMMESTHRRDLRNGWPTTIDLEEE